MEFLLSQMNQHPCPESINQEVWLYSIRELVDGIITNDTLGKMVRITSLIGYPNTTYLLYVLRFCLIQYYISQYFAPSIPQPSNQTPVQNTELSLLCQRDLDQHDHNTTQEVVAVLKSQPEGDQLPVAETLPVVQAVHVEEPPVEGLPIFDFKTGLQQINQRKRKKTETTTHTYECKECGKIYASTDGVRKHWRNHHPHIHIRNGHVEDYSICHTCDDTATAEFIAVA